MNNTDLTLMHELPMQTKAYQRKSKAAALKKLQATEEAQEREYMRRDMRTSVLATIDELHQYLQGNVTIEAATDAARELAHQLNHRW